MADRTDHSKSLTGIWNGLYTYPAEVRMPESHFVATLFDGGVFLSGTIHENMQRGDGTAIPANAAVDGTRDGNHVAFIKSYDGLSGLGHSVHYVGTLAEDGDEIEGQWHIHTRRGDLFSGRFLMIRTRGKRAAVETEAFEHAR